MASATKETVKAKVIYSLEDNNTKVFREAENHKEQIALFDPKEGICELHKDHTNLRARVSQFLNEHQDVRFKEFAKIGQELQPKNVPPRPKQHPARGYKTTAVVEWYAIHNRPVFLTKYGIREVQVRTHFDEYDTEVRAESGKMETLKIRNPIYKTIQGLEFDLDKVKSGEQRLIADCATHLTTKMKEASDTADNDWDVPM